MQIFRPQLPLLDDYYAAGIIHFICDAHGPDFDLSLHWRLIEWRDDKSRSREVVRRQDGKTARTIVRQ